jgi:hypothetical protein
MSRPFPIVLEPLGSPNRLDVALYFQVVAGDEIRQRVQEVLTTFARLGAVGGLAGRDVDPAQPGLTLESGQVDEHSALWRFRDVHIDPNSLQILANMVHYVHLEDVPLQLARFGWSNEQVPSIQSDARFPEAWRRPSFHLEIGDLLDDIDLVVELQEPQSEETLARIIDAMSMWLLATHRGAYADESFGPSDTAVFLGPDVMQVSPNRIVWFIEILRCNEGALDGLLNVLEWAHHNVTPISRVEIGP